MSLSQYWFRNRFYSPFDPSVSRRHFIIVFNKGTPGIIGHYWCEYLDVLGRSENEALIVTSLNLCSQFSFPRNKAICKRCWELYSRFGSLVDRSGKVEIVD